MQAGWWTDDEIKINQNYGVILEKIYVINSSFPYLPPRIKETWSEHGQSLHLHLNNQTTAHTLQCCSAADMICSLQLC